MTEPRNALRSPNASNLLELTTTEKLERFKTTRKNASKKKPDACPVCEQTMWVSFFFDGTGQNVAQDYPLCKASNPAKLFLIANGNAPTEAKLPISVTSRVSFRADTAQFAYYLSGVGTPFNETVKRGEPATPRNSSALTKAARVIARTSVPTTVALAAAGLAGQAAQEVWKYSEDSTALGGGVGAGADKRIDQAFDQLDQSLKGQAKRKVVRIALFGFSRGAAIARIFASRLSKKIRAGDYGDKSVSIEFMGLFDTVASFGLPATSLKADDLVIPLLVKKCVHMVAVHEFRFAFPVWTIRSAPGYDKHGYEEYVYPGVHTDVGGGYAPKGVGRVEDHHWVSNNLSAIPLRHMYAKAIAAGVPLASIEEVIETPLYKTLFAATTATGSPDTLALKAYNDYVNTVQASGPLELQVVEHHRELCRWWGMRQTNGIANVEPLLKPLQQEVDAALRERNQAHFVGVSAEAQQREWAIRHAQDARLRAAKSQLETQKSGMAFTTDLIGEEARELNDRSDNSLLNKLDYDELTRLRAFQAAKPASTATLLEEYLHDSVQWFGTEALTKHFVYRYFRVRGVHEGSW